MPVGPTLELTLGTARDFLLQVRTPQGDAYDGEAYVSPFLGTDALAARLWQGADTATILTPSATWVDATGVASFTVSFASSDTAPLAAGIYRLQVTVTRGGKTGLVFDGRLRLAAAPGSGSVPLAFTVLSDLTQYAPWLEDLQSDLDETAFAIEQGRATNQLISDLVMMWQPDNFGPTIGQPGFNALSIYGSGGIPPSKWLRDNLTPLVPNSSVPSDMGLNRLNTAPNLIQPRVSTALLLYDEVLEICAKWAIVLICKAQVAEKSERDWWALARMFNTDANNLFLSRKFEVDLSDPQTGWPSITIHGGASRLR